MPTRRLVLFALLVGLLVAPAGAAPTPESELREAYRQDTAAFNRGDVTAMMKDIAPSFVYRSTDEAPENRAAYEMTLKKVATLKASDECTLKSIVLHPSAAEVVVSDVMTYVDKAGHHIVESSTNRESWRHTETGWKILGSTELERHYTVDGKPSTSSHLPKM